MRLANEIIFIILNSFAFPTCANVENGVPILQPDRQSLRGGEFALAEFLTWRRRAFTG